MSTPKYLTSEDISNLMGIVKPDISFVPMSQDSYNETAVVQAILATGKKEELLMAAINLGIIGYGNRRYGQFKLKEKLVEIAVLLAAAGVKFGLTKDAKLNEGDLTPQRLCRAFRYHIKAYLEETKAHSYIYRKYSTHELRYSNILFRGAEYLDDLKKDEVDYILETYESMDAKTNLNLSDRVLRIFQAKGYVKRTVS
jgi:hypothetical protein